MSRSKAEEPIRSCEPDQYLDALEQVATVAGRVTKALSRIDALENQHQLCVECGRVGHVGEMFTAWDEFGSRSYVHNWCGAGTKWERRKEVGGGKANVEKRA